MTLELNGVEFDFFTTVNLKLEYATISGTFSLSALFDPSIPAHKVLFRPLAFHKVRIKEDGTTLMTGVILSHNFTHSSEKALVTIAGYSITGVLQDSSIPTSVYPYEFNNMSLRAIIERVIKPFGVRLVVRDSALQEATSNIDQTTANHGESVASFVSKIATQRNLILSNDNLGNLVLDRPRALGDIVTFYDESAPMTRIDLSIDGQKINNPLTLQSQSDLYTDNAADETVYNPAISKSIFRPLVKQQQSGAINDTKLGVNSLISASLEGINLTIVTDRWYWLNGSRLELLRPNEFIGVRSENVYIQNISRWFVTGVEFSGSPTEQTAILKCVVPEVYINDGTFKNPFS